MIGLGPATINNAGGPLASLASGAGDTILEMNPGDTAPTYYPVSGDATCSAGVFTVKGISGATPIPITANEVQWATGASPKFSQATAASGATPATWHFAPQPPNAGSATTASGTPAGLTIDLAAPVSTGLEAFVEVTRAGNVVFAVGPNTNSANTAFWLFPASAAQTPSSSNTLFTVAAGALYIAPPSSGGIHYRPGGAATGSTALMTTAGTQLGSESAQFGGGVIVVGITNATTDPTTAPTGAGILWERLDGSALAHFGSGGFVVDIAPSGTGTKNTQAMAERERKFVASSSSTTPVAAGSLNLNAYRGKQINIQLFQQSRDVTTPSTANMGSIITQILVANVAGVVSVVGSSTVLGSPLGSALAAVTFDVSVTDVLKFMIANAAGGTSTDTWDWTLHSLLDAN